MAKDQKDMRSTERLEKLKTSPESPKIAFRWKWVLIPGVLLFILGGSAVMFQSCDEEKSTVVVERQLCSNQELVPFTKSLSDINREDPEMVGLPAIASERCITLVSGREEFGRPAVFTYEVSRKGFDAKGTITLKTIREESDGWDRVLYSETYTNPLDGPRTHQAEGVLWCKNGYCNGVGKDPSGKPLARRLLLGKVLIKK